MEHPLRQKNVMRCGKSHNTAEKVLSALLKTIFTVINFISQALGYTYQALQCTNQALGCIFQGLQHKLCNGENTFL